MTCKNFEDIHGLDPCFYDSLQIHLVLIWQLSEDPDLKIYNRFTSGHLTPSSAAHPHKIPFPGMPTPPLVQNSVLTKTFK